MLCEVRLDTYACTVVWCAAHRQRSCTHMLPQTAAIHARERRVVTCNPQAERQAEAEQRWREQEAERLRSLEQRQAARAELEGRRELQTAELAALKARLDGMKAQKHDLVMQLKQVGGHHGALDTVLALHWLLHRAGGPGLSQTAGSVLLFGIWVMLAGTGENSVTLLAPGAGHRRHAAHKGGHRSGRRGRRGARRCTAGGTSACCQRPTA